MILKTIRHLFFDLDHTLWDFDRNSAEVLEELFHKYKLGELGIDSFELFHTAYKERNALMWEQYRLGKITKTELRDQRFILTFWDMGLDTDLVPKEMGVEYLLLAPKKNHLFPHAHEVLSYLKEKYTLHIITNGFEEAQHIKLNSSDLTKYFKEIIISEHTGYKKPDIRIFHYSAEKANATPEECVMVGDGLEVDILGAQSAGWDTVFFNPHGTEHNEKPTFEIRSLDALMELF